MVPGKDAEEHFWDLEVGDTYAIQRTVDDVIYGLWGTKNANYVMRMMDTGVRLLEDDT